MLDRNFYPCIHVRAATTTTIPPPNPTAVISPEYNDPRQPMDMKTETMDQFPVYIRFEPEDDDFWCVDRVVVRVNLEGAKYSG
jgi:hypothetical protein